MTGEDTKMMQKTIELCQAIVDQPEFQDMRRRVDAFLGDESARNHYQRVVDRGESLQSKQQRGATLSNEEIREFEDDREALVKNPIAKGFLDAQQEMHEMRQSVNKYIAKTFEVGRLPNPEDFEACGHGCSCGH